MSLIKLQGNASGTGAFTIAAPNGNTDRTLTLPDATGTVTVAPAGAVNFTAAPSGAMTLDASGRLLVGTTGTPSGGSVGAVFAKAATTNIQVHSTSGGGAMYGGLESGGAIFYTYTGAVGSETYTERARIDASGRLMVGTTVWGANDNGFLVDADGTTIQVKSGGASTLTQYYIVGGTAIGSITTNGTSVAYNTSSDYRLKENVQPMQDALAVVAQLNPVTYTWKADGSAGQGFIAHELQAVVPDCVTGEKDAVDEDGNPMYQGVDTSFLVATLTKAIQELKAELDAAKTRIAALEGATE